MVGLVWVFRYQVIVIVCVLWMVFCSVSVWLLCSSIISGLLVIVIVLVSVCCVGGRVIFICDCVLLLQCCGLFSVSIIILVCSVVVMVCLMLFCRGVFSVQFGMIFSRVLLLMVVCMLVFSVIQCDLLLNSVQQFLMLLWFCMNGLISVIFCLVFFSGSMLLLFFRSMIEWCVVLCDSVLCVVMCVVLVLCVRFSEWQGLLNRLIVFFSLRMWCIDLFSVVIGILLLVIRFGRCLVQKLFCMFRFNLVVNVLVVVLWLLVV